MSIPVSESFMDKVCRWVAWHLPRHVVYHAYVRLHGYATSRPPWSNKHPSECTWDDALKSWNHP